MLEPENLLDSVENTGYKLRKTSSRNGRLHRSCTFPNESLFVTTTTDGTLHIQDMTTCRVLLTLELQLRASITPGTIGSQDPSAHRVNLAWSNMIALQNRMLVFTLNHSNQLLLASLSNDHAQVFGDQVCLLGSHRTPVTTMCVDDKRSVLISGDSSGLIRLWPLSWDSLQIEGAGTRWRPKPTPLSPMQAHQTHVSSLCFNNNSLTSNNSKFVSCGGDLGVVKVWQVTSDHQSLSATLLQTLECGHDYHPACLCAHNNLCALGTKCGKVFLWDHEELELLMVAEEPGGVDSLSLHSSPSHQPICVCANKAASVKIFRPNDSFDWQLMAECYLGARLLLNEVNKSECLILLAGLGNTISEGSTELDLVFKQWPLSTLPSSPPVQASPKKGADNDREGPPQPRPNPPPLPTPKQQPPPGNMTNLVRQYEEPEIEDVVGVEIEECSFNAGEQHSLETSAANQRNPVQRHASQEAVSERYCEKVGEPDGGGGGGDDDDDDADDADDNQDYYDENTKQVPESMYKSTSVLASAALNSTAKLKQQYVEAQQEKFGGHLGSKISEEGMKYAARMPAIPLEDKSRYQNLEKLNPALPTPPKKTIKKQVSAHWQHQVQSYALEDSDYYLPDWGEPPGLLATGFGLRSSGRELLESMKKDTQKGRAPRLGIEELWQLQRRLTLERAASAFN